jgi:SAM-dependent methyltransferase
MRQNTEPRHDGTQGYAEQAEKLAKQYESLTFADVHRDVLHLIPTEPVQVLDIGAGSGRDAAALAAIGHQVLAVEPTSALRNLGQSLHPGQSIIWLDDGLPGLKVVVSRQQRFGLVMLTGVWMHLDARQRGAAMPMLRSLLDDCGRMVLSLRHGPVPEGRRMFEVSAEETIALARDHGLVVLHHSKREDMLNRADVGWSWLVFERPSSRIEK